MKNFKKLILYFIIVLFIYVFFVIVSHFLLKKQLSVSYENVSFDISSVFNIDESRISSESEVFKKDILIEYNCKIDSTYCLTVIKLCDSCSFNYQKTIQHSVFPFPSRIGAFNTSITSAHPINNFLESLHIPFYNYKLLPLNTISKCELYVDGEIKERVYDSLRNVLFYNIFGKGISFSFNYKNKSDLIFSSSQNKQIITLIFFIYDKKMYTGLFSTIKGNEMTLEQIERI